MWGTLGGGILCQVSEIILTKLIEGKNPSMDNRLNKTMEQSSVEVTGRR